MGSAWAGLAAAVVAGALAGALMGLLTVTIGVNQHVAGIGTTLGLVAACDYTSRVLFGSGSQTRVPKFTRLFEDVDIVGQYLLTWIALLVVAPLLWWVLRSTGAGLRLRAVGENPEAADVAGISVAATRYVALVGGGALMAVGGAFLTLALLGSFTIDIVSGRGWVCIALVIFGRWGVWPTVAGALLFGAADALQLQLAITPEFGDVPERAADRRPVPGRHRRPRDLGPRHPLSGRLPAPVPPSMRQEHESMTDNEYLQAAIAEARVGLAEGGIPIGAALVVDGEVLAVGHNRRVQEGSAIKHGETDCLENAGRLPASVYARSTMVTTLSPCDMCTGAILLYGIPRVVVGENTTFMGGEDYLRSRGVEVVVLDDPECVADDDRLHRRQPRPLERGHRRGLTAVR